MCFVDDAGFHKIDCFLLDIAGDLLITSDGLAIRPCDNDRVHLLQRPGVSQCLRVEIDSSVISPRIQDFLSEGAYKWLARSASGSPAEREAAKRVMTKYILYGPAAGAMAGTETYDATR